MKDGNLDFMEFFSFMISNIFVELLITHINSIYSKRIPSALLKNVTYCHFKISKSKSKWQNFRSHKF